MAPSEIDNKGSLADFSIALAGVHSSHPELKKKKIADIKALIAACGGSYLTKVSDECTHLVGSQEQYAKQGAKVLSAAQHPGIKVVSFDWLALSLQSKSQIDENAYILSGTGDEQDLGPGDNLFGDVFPDNAADQATIQNDSQHTRSFQQDGAIRKRQRSDSLVEDLATAPKTKRTKASQKAKSPSVNIPVDAECNLKSQGYQVFTDSEGVIFDATLNQTNSGGNNNKFYIIQLLVHPGKGSFFTWTRWGRVGLTGQSKLLGDGGFQSAFRAFDKKFCDKNGNTWANRENEARSGKYTFVERSYEDSSNDDVENLPRAGKSRASKESLESRASVESKLPGAVQRLMKLIFNIQFFNDTLADLNYDANKMPLGKLSKRTVTRGYEVLKELAALIGDQDLATSLYNTTWASAVEERSNKYFSFIPHDFGRRRPPILSRIEMIKKEVELLETLTDMRLANDIIKMATGNRSEEENTMATIDRQYRGLNLNEMTPLEIGGSEFELLQEYLIKSAGATHGITYQVQDIFRIERGEEKARLGSMPGVAMSERRLLWHGSRVTNFGGILSHGLRIAPPEAPVSGYMFGKGVYLADMSTKSANYCAAYSSDNTALLLLCEAELGSSPLKLTNADYNAGDQAKEKNRLSTWGVGATAPQAWKDAGCVHGDLKGVLMPDMDHETGPSMEQGANLLYNEYIVYDVAQIRLRYLLRVEIKPEYSS